MHRSHAGVLVEPIARLELRCSCDELLHQRVVHAFLHVQALGGQALLAAVEKPPDSDRPRRALEVRVVENDAGVAAAQLERDLLEMLGSLGHDPFAGGRGSRERDLPDQRMLHDCLAGGLADDDVDDPFGQAAFNQGLDAGERRQRRGARGLEHDGVSGRDRRCDLVGGQSQRKVPGHDGAADADRLAHYEPIGREVGQPDVLAVDLVSKVGEPPDVLAETLGLEPRLEKRFALFLGQDHGDLLDLAEHVLGGFVKDLAPLVGRKLGPGGERLGRRLRGFVDIGRSARGHLVDELAGRRIPDLVRLAGRSPRPLAFDDHRRHSGTPLRVFWLSR